MASAQVMTTKYRTRITRKRNAIIETTLLTSDSDMAGIHRLCNKTITYIRRRYYILW